MEYATEINEFSSLSRYMCPEMHEVGIYGERECSICGAKMEFIGDFDEVGLENEIRERQLAKFKQL